MPRRVFYSFYYDDDADRIQQIKNIGAIESQPLLTGNKWEEVKKGGDDAIKRWINDQMKGKTCLVALVGARTASRPWVRYEIVQGSPMSTRVTLYNPTGYDSKAVYADISRSIENLVENAIRNCTKL